MRSPSFVPSGVLPRRILVNPGRTSSSRIGSSGQTDWRAASLAHRRDVALRLVERRASSLPRPPPASAERPDAREHSARRDHRVAAQVQSPPSCRRAPRPPRAVSTASDDTFPRRRQSSLYDPQVGPAIARPPVPTSRGHACERVLRVDEATLREQRLGDQRRLHRDRPETRMDLGALRRSLLRRDGVAREQLEWNADLGQRGARRGSSPSSSRPQRPRVRAPCAVEVADHRTQSATIAPEHAPRRSCRP